MLVDHGDTGRDRVSGVRERHPAAGELDPAAVRGVEAVDDPHQGGLARPVLTDDRVDGPLDNFQADVVEGLDSAETLAYMAGRKGQVSHAERPAEKDTRAPGARAWFGSRLLHRGWDQLPFPASAPVREALEIGVVIDCDGPGDDGGLGRRDLVLD